MKILFLFISLISFNIFAEVKPFHIEMDVGNDLVTVARSNITLEKQDKTYQLKTQTKALGVFSLFNQDTLIEVTTLKQKPERFYPLHYQYTNIQTDKTDTASYEFNYEKQLVIHHKKGKRIEIDLKENAYDPNSIILGLVTWLKNNYEIYKTENLSRIFIYHDHYRAWEEKYNIGKEETLHLPYGEIKAIKISPETDNEKKTNVWISVEKDFLPVKIEQVVNGKVELKMELNQIY